MNEQCKKDEKLMIDIISNNVKTTDHNKKLKIIIYYHHCKVKNLIIINNIISKNDKLATSHVVYEVQCPRGDCALPNASYIYWTNPERNFN